jgi:hypothetical protein
MSRDPKDYKKKIKQKYDDLEAKSMKFADQAILDLRDLLNLEKNNILGKVTLHKILNNIHGSTQGTM